MGESGGAGVDGAEAEDVEQGRAAVVEQLADCFADELQVRVGEEGDPFHRVDAVDVGEDAEECDVPGGGIDHVGEGDGQEGHLVRVERGRGRVDGEELDVQGGGGGGDGDHALGIVVQVLEQDLADGVDARGGGVGRRRRQ